MQIYTYLAAPINNPRSTTRGTVEADHPSTAQQMVKKMFPDPVLVTLYMNKNQYDWDGTNLAGASDHPEYGKLVMDSDVLKSPYDTQPEPPPSWMSSR